MFDFLKKDNPEKEALEQKLEKVKAEKSKWIACRDIERFNAEDFYFAEVFTDVFIFASGISERYSYRCMITGNTCLGVDCKRCTVAVKKQETRLLFPDIDVR